MKAINWQNLSGVKTVRAVDKFFSIRRASLAAATAVVVAAAFEAVIDLFE